MTGPPGARRLLWPVALVSAAVLGFEVALMRLLLVASWHHFAFLVISVALLGFGASGTALCFVRGWAVPRGERVLFGLVLAAAAAMPLCAAVAQHIPIEARLAPGMAWGQAASWLGFWAVLFVPFFLGAAAVGLALMLAPAQAGVVYAANLLGSAAGAILAPLLMALVPPAWLPVMMGGLALAGAAGCVPVEPRRSARLALCVAVVGGVAGWLLVDRPHVRPDPYKRSALMQRLVEQGSVERVAARYGPRAVVEAYRGGVLHDIPFLAVGESPPAVTVLLSDGHTAGSVIDVGTPEAAGVMDRTLMAFPYGLVAVRPRVALLGETGMTNVWLAARHDAERINVVQPDANVIRLLRGPLRDAGGVVLDLAGAAVIEAEPRHFLARTGHRYDLIQLSVLESSAAGSGGVGGLAEDHLVTVEGISSCLDALEPGGMLAVTRGIQIPPRDNVKLLAIVSEALRRRGAEEPGRHVVIVRDYLAVCTVVKAEPWTPQELARVRSLCRSRQLTPVWFEGVEPGELNRPDALDPAPDGVGDLYHYAATRLFSDQAGDFIGSWSFDVRPATDDRPFFADFCRLGSLGAMREAYGDGWLTRTELAFLFVVSAGVLVAAIGAAATVLPLPFLPGAGGRGRGAVVVYFGSLGLGYLLLEMVWLSRLGFLIGDPVRAASITIGGFLLFSGLGSLTAQRVGTGGGGRVVLGVAVGAVVLLGVVETLALPGLATALGGLPPAARCAAGLAAVAPLAFAMGFPMPMGLMRLDGGVVAWAWGINGFASVTAAPLAIATAMTWGYPAVAGGALGLYAVAGLCFGRLPENQPG